MNIFHEAIKKTWVGVFSEHSV